LQAETHAHNYRKAVKPFGVRGEMKIEPMTISGAIQNLDRCIWFHLQEKNNLRVKSVRYAGKALFLLLKDMILREGNKTKRLVA